MQALGTFGLIWCTGVLYHNAEQFRLLRRLHLLAEPGAVLVLESAITRNPRFRDCPAVEIFWPETYRGTGTVTHLPSKKAIVAWLEMAGWRNIAEVPCYARFNPDVIDQRVALLAERLGETDLGFEYYARSGLNPAYKVGDAN